MVEYEIGKEFLNRQEANIFSTTIVLKTTVSLFSVLLFSCHEPIHFENVKLYDLSWFGSADSVIVGPL